MAEKLIQMRVEDTIKDTIKDTCDDLFAQQGLTTQGAIRMFLTQVANSGETPFDGLFSNKN